MRLATTFRPGWGVFLWCAALAGCFTEVGNAEDDRLVQAEFQIDYNPLAGPVPKLSAKSIETTYAVVNQFYLDVREAEFHFYDSASGRQEEVHLWKEDSAILSVDFTGADKDARLPNRKVGILNPLFMNLQCALRPHIPMNTDTLDYDRFHDRSYIKGLFVTGKDSVRFLFAIPVGGELGLNYGKSLIDGWYGGGVYHCEFIFFANRWIAGTNVTAAVQTRLKDSSRAIILDQEHNSALHDTLEARFTQAFNASSAQITMDR